MEVTVSQILSDTYSTSKPAVPGRMRMAAAAMSSPSHILFNNLALAKNQLPAIILGFVSRDPVDESAVPG
jgi:hypothetical protein